MRPFLISVLLLLPCLGAPHAFRERDLAEPGSLVLDLAFSPDGTRLAALVRPPGSTCGQPDQLLVTLSDGSGLARHMAVPCDSAFTWNHVLHWSASASYIAVDAPSQVTVIRLATGSRCRIPYPGRFAGFIDDTRMLAAPPLERPQRRLLTRDDLALAVYGGDCRLKDRVKVPWRPHAVEAFGLPRLVLLCDPDTQGQLLLDLTRGVPLASLRLPYHNHVFQFGDRGRVLCAASTPDASFQRPTVCYDVTRGTEILPEPAVRNGAPLDVARAAPLLAVHDASALAVWDLRRGREVARLHPQPQGPPFDAALGRRPWSIPARAALSPDGRLLAVGSGALVRLFRLE